MIPVYRVDGPGLCARPGCPTDAVSGFLCSAHAQEHERRLGRTRKNRPARTGNTGGRPILKPWEFEPGLDWLDLDELAAAVAVADATAPPIEGLCGTPYGAEVDFFAPLKAQANLARLVCARCPNLYPCLAGAIVRREEFGVWGGTNRAERSRIRRALRRRRATAPTTAVG